MNPEALDDLSRSIREFGIIEPILVTRKNDGGYVLIAGERRVKAARKAGLTSVPAIERRGDAEEMLAVALIENIQRENLNAVDEALAYRRLRDEFGLTQDEVAERVGKSRVAVANGLRLLQLPDDVLADVSRGTLTAGHARAILAVKEDQGRIALWKQIKDGQLTVRAAEEAARATSTGSRVSRPRPARKPATPDPHVTYLEDRLRQVLGTQVKITARGKGGRIELDYYDDADLDRLLALLGVGDEL